MYVQEFLNWFLVFLWFLAIYMINNVLAVCKLCGLLDLITSEGVLSYIIHVSLKYLCICVSSIGQTSFVYFCGYLLILLLIIYHYDLSHKLYYFYQQTVCFIFYPSFIPSLDFNLETNYYFGCFTFQQLISIVKL